MAKILLVDDDKLMIRMYQGKFEDDGYIVETATNGEMGLARAFEFKPDLILLDIMMPKVNGLEMLKKLKENKEIKKIPVVLLTNVGGSKEDVDQGLSLGAVAYLVKAHYDAKDVVKKVKEVLSGYVHELPKVEVSIDVEPKLSKDRKDDKEGTENAKKLLEEARREVKEAQKKLEKLKN